MEPDVVACLASFSTTWRSSEVSLRGRMTPSKALSPSLTDADLAPHPDPPAPRGVPGLCPDSLSVDRSFQPFSFFLACSCPISMQDSHSRALGHAGHAIARPMTVADESVPFDPSGGHGSSWLGHFRAASQSRCFAKADSSVINHRPKTWGSVHESFDQASPSFPEHRLLLEVAKRSHHRFSVILSTARLGAPQALELFTEEEAGSPQIASGVLDDAGPPELAPPRRMRKWIVGVETPAAL